MGYFGQMSWTFGNKWGIQSNYDITLDDVSCSSGEWSSCTFSLSNNCDHSKDVFLHCDGTDFSLVDSHGDTIGAGILGLLISNGGTVCDDYFTDYSANAICRKMGYFGQMSWTFGNKWGIQSNYDITLDDVSCSSDFSLVDSHGDTIGAGILGLLISDGGTVCHDYFTDYSADAICREMGYFGQMSWTSDFSLVDSHGDTIGANILGLLISDGGTVCDDYFTGYSADAICRQMGYFGQVSWTSGNKWGIQSNYDITLDDVSCSSGEWSSCTFSLSNNCGHSKDVFLQCDGDFSLVDSHGDTIGAGILGLLISNGGTVCHDYFTDYSADAICREMGYMGQMTWTSGNKWGIQSNYDITLDDVSCSSGEWSSCTFSLSNNCDHSKDVFLQCYQIGDLVDSHGDTIGAGILGLLISDGGTVCDDYFTKDSADAICREMGYFGRMSWTSGNKWGIQSNYDITLDDVSCSSGEWNVESVNIEVKKGSHATISCIITGITEIATVTWRTSTGPVPAEKFTPVQGSHSAGTQTSTLAVDGTLVTEDTAYTCRVTSGSLPDSNFSDTSVNLNVYDVESVYTEVKKGSYATISCIITGITGTAAVTWRTSTGSVPAEKFTHVQGSYSAGTQKSTLAVDGTLVNKDTAYTCRVTSGSLPDSIFSDTTVNLNVYDVESVNTEVKKGSYTTISCIITGITETAVVTWRTSTGPVPGDKLVPTQGRHSAGTQTSTLAVDGTLVNEDTAYTCRVTSGSLPDSNFSDTTVNLNVYDVESVNTEVKKGSYAMISCIITGITETSAVTWRTSTGPVPGDKFTPVQGSYSAGTQTSTLAVDGTLVNEDTAYTCRVTSGSLPDSNFSDTTVNLNVYDVESVNTEVKKGSYATISCIITGITETAAVTWRTSTGPVPAEKFTPVQGSYSAGTQTSTLAIHGTLVNEDTAYTCRVTSGSLPDSNFSDTTVNLKVYDVESVNTEVKKGSYATISCIINGITETAAVTWRTSTGPVPAEKFTPVKGSYSAGTQTSTLAVDGTLVNEDTAYTCRVTSGSLPDSNFSDTTVNLNVYDVESVNTEVKIGFYATISCIITGITETATVTWRTSTGPVPGDKLVPTQGSYSDGTQTSTLKVDGTLVNEDTAYTCRVTSGSLPDSNFSDTIVNLNVYDVESVNTEVKKGSYAMISCIITGITETSAVTWRTSTGPVQGDKFTPVQGSYSAGTQTSTLAVDGTLVNEDTAYTCRVTSGSLPDSNFSDTTVNLNVYDVESVNTEVKKGSYATISCIITGITGTAAVTWRTSTGPVPGDKLVPTQGSYSDGRQTSTLAVDGTLVNEDTAYTCRVTSGSLPDSNFSDTTVNLNVYDVESVNTEVKEGSYATISCIITGITETAAVTWRTSTGPVPAEKLTPVKGSYSAGTQTSTLAVDGTLVNEDTAYTCRVTSGSLPDSNFSDTTVNLNVYDVESVNTEVKKGSYATISCIITGITETAAVTWRTSTGPVPGDKLVPTQGSYSDGRQTSTLAVDGTLVNEDTAYTCRVTSGSLPDSNFSDTTVNLNVYDVESVNTEVKKGSYATISCIITGITETAAVTWRTSTGPVSAEKFTTVQGSYSAETQTSTLAVDGTLVNEDTAYTCRVTSGSLPDSNFSDTTVNLNVYDVELVNTEVKKGSYATISCIITGITETAAVTWRTNTGPVPGDKLVPTQGSYSDGRQTSTLAVDGTLVNEDTAYTCRVTSGSLPDSNFSDTTVNLNVYDVESVNTEVKKGSYATISCIITGITETAAVTWRTSTGPVSAEKFTTVQGSYSAETQTSTLAVDGTLVNEDTAYTCRVTSGSLPDSNFSDTTVNLNVYDVESVNTEVKKGSYATISCIITGITETAAVTWRTSTGPVPAEKFTPVQGSHSSGTQTSTLAVDGTLVNEDTAYTCRVTSGSLPDSNFSDTTVNLNVYDVESVITEVKKGSYAMISCIITGITETAAVTWRTSTGPVSAEKFTPVQERHSAGTQTSTLAIDGTLVNEDTAYTCRVTSGSLPDSNFSDTTVNLNVYGMFFNANNNFQSPYSNSIQLTELF
ncbi:basement membrane-specific heparan sulfate proteoglycan core protein-like [Bolinopsis microptera]|uniref:basement membrane-specific heparan sulfate proteoglycan core protein-like n=1 Tax=Bolinopsis microptera TaxID=2820187 RepID=UPI00307B003B